MNNSSPYSFNGSSRRGSFCLGVGLATLAKGRQAVACSHPLDPKSTQEELTIIYSAWSWIGHLSILSGVQSTTGPKVYPRVSLQ